MKKKIAWLAVACIVSACDGAGFGKPEYPPKERPVLHTTISADGQMVATLLHAGTDQQLLRVSNLKTGVAWRTVEAPRFTRSIRFGLQGHQLLLTHRRPAPPMKDYLSKLDLDQLGKGLERIYESEDGLAFPVEVAPGQVMVRTHKPADPKTGKLFLGDSYWILVGPGQKVQKVGPESILPYPAPNIVNDGFFWVEEQIGETKDAHPKILSYALPGGVAPSIDRKRFGKYTHTVECDQKASRCLRSHITNYNGPRGDFVYGVDALTDTDQCYIPEADGFSDGMSLTPTGSAAVMSLATGYDKPRYVVVMHFNARQCAPTAIQILHFKEG